MLRPPGNLRLSVKVALLGAGSALVTAAALIGLATWQSGQYHALARAEVNALIDADLDHITHGVYSLVQTEDEAVQQQVNGNLRVARHVLASAGAVSLSHETVTWRVLNQFADEPAELRLPKLLVGGRWLGQNVDPAVETAVVDEVTRLIDETATLFQRMNEHGDMLRVATTVTTTHGRRAIGTYVPALNPDGAANPVIATVIRGETYRGRAFVVNAWHLTAYEPIKDRAGELVGMLYVGVKQQSAESRVRQAVLQTKVGKTGYVYVLGGKGEERGRYIVSQRGERDGEDIWENKDSDGRPVIKEILGRAMALKPGELATERYRWQNPDEPAPRWKVARLAYYAPWDWVIGTSVYEDELQAYRAVLSGGRLRMTHIMGLAGLAITLLVGLAGLLVAWTIARPVEQMRRAAAAITQGDLHQVVEVHSRDEIGDLANTFNFMTDQLRQNLEGLRQENLDRKKAEESLRGSEERLRSITSAALDAIVMMDDGGRICFWNKAAEAMFGWSLEEAWDKDLHTLLAPSLHRESSAAGLVEFLQHGRGPVLGQTLALTAVRRDGREFPIELSVAPVLLHGKHQAVGIIRDTTERKRAEVALRESKEKFRTLFAQSADANFLLENGIVFDCNEAALRLLGGERQGIIGRTLAQLSPGCQPDGQKSPAKVASFLEQALLQGSSRFEWTHQRGDGTPIDTEVMLTAVRLEGRPILHAMVRDITERKRAELERQRLQAQLIQAQKMEAIGQLAGGVAHDFNNILTAILMHLSLLQDNVQVSAEVRAGLKELETEAKRAANLTRQLLMFSRRQVLQPQVLDLNSLLGNLLKMLCRLIGEHVGLEFKAAPGALWVAADPGMLEQVVMNLVVNARDAMPQGGRVTLTTQFVQFDGTVRQRNPEAYPGLFASLTVSDTGCGMDEATLKHIFEPFFTTKEPGKGTGLGLATVFGIVKQHGGWVEVTSAVGQGTSFRVLLPVKSDATAVLVQPAEEAQVRGGDEVVLVVEDEGAVRNNLVTMLAQHGYRVRGAGNGPEAFRVWEQFPEQPDLLITDMVMPGGMSGLELSEHLQQQKPSLRVILMSGYSTAMAQQGVPRTPGLRFLQKPFSAVTLARLVRECLDAQATPK